MAVKELQKELTIKHTGFLIAGTSLINLWGGGQGEVFMDETTIDDPTTENIIKAVNDGRFGCESIESATVHLNAIYERGITIPCGEFCFNREELSNAKRGI